MKTRKELLENMKAHAVQMRMDADDDGQWITTENGHHIHLNEEGVPDKGNPHVLAAMSSSGRKKGQFNFQALKRSSGQQAMSNIKELVAKKTITLQDALYAGELEIDNMEVGQTISSRSGKEYVRESREYFKCEGKRIPWRQVADTIIREEFEEAENKDRKKRY